MTLKEKFDETLTYLESKSKVIECEKIADDFAIEFAEWCIERDEHYPVQAGRITVKELLKIYKKEKGL